MQFLDDSLLPENQPPLVIQVAPYGPEFLPGDSDDIPVTMAEQVQKAVNSLVCDGLAMAQRDQVICVAAQLPKFAMGVGPMDF